MTRKIHINVINPSEAELELLQLLFTQNETQTNLQKKTQNVFKRANVKKDRYIDLVIPGNGTRKPEHVEIELSHTIRRFNRGRNKKGFRYYVISNEKHANGTFGRVKKIKAKYALLNNKLSLDRNVNLILKKVRAQRSIQSVQHLEREYDLTRRAKHLRVKPLLIETRLTDVKGYFVMKDLPGDDLADVIDNDFSFKPGTPQITIKNRIIIAIKLLRALRDQVDGNGLVHRDIKPTNIKISADGKCNIFDFGISKLVDEHDIGEGACTPQYAPPESLEGEDSSSKSDIYSMGVTLAKLFGAALREDLDCDYQDQLCQYLEMPAYFYLFSGVPNVSSVHAEQLKALFEAMTAAEQDKRPEVNDCLAVLEGMLEELVLADTPSAEQNSVMQALRMAVQLDRELSNLRRTNDFLSLHFKPALPLIVSAVQSAINNIDETPCALQTFIKYSDIEIFQGLTSKKDLIDETKKVVSEFNQKIDALMTLNEDARCYANILLMRESNVTHLRLADKIRRLQEDVAEVLGKHEGYDFTLNDIALLNTKYRSNLANLKARMTEISLDPAIIKIDLSHIRRKADKTTLRHDLAATGMGCLNDLDKKNNGLSFFSAKPKDEELFHLRKLTNVLMRDYKDESEFRKVMQSSIENISSNFIERSQVKAKFKEMLMNPAHRAKQFKL